MDLHQLQTFAAVAREGSITRASELLHLSQPAVSAHIKAIEDTLGLTLFERTPRGMSLTRDGERLLVRAEQTLAAHRELMAEATRIKGGPTGTLRLGAASNSARQVVGRLLTELARRYPEIEVVLEHGSSREICKKIRGGGVDAGLYHEAAEPEPALTTLEVGRFDIHIVAPPGRVAVGEPVDWRALAEVPWIYPAASACCGRTAEELFKRERIRPGRIISVDREDVTRTLIAGGVGVGLLHDDTSRAAQARGEVELVHECRTPVRVLFAHLASRAHDPVLAAVTSILGAGPGS